MSEHPEDERLRKYERDIAKETEFVNQYADAIRNPIFVPSSFEDLRAHDIYKAVMSWKTDTLGIVALSIVATLVVVFLMYTLSRLLGLGVVGWVRLAAMVITIVTIFSWTKQTFS